MTREEKQKAIDVLKISAPVITVTQKEFEDYIQTLNKIMNWLEQEPCDDAISRQAVIDATVKKNSIWNSITNSKGENLEEIISQLPPVTPTEKVGQWIPVSERLPEVALDEYGIRCSKDVLVCDGTDLRVGYFVKNIKRDFNYWVVYGEYYIEPKAWMPLPLPYKASPTGVEKE